MSFMASIDIELILQGNDKHNIHGGEGRKRMDLEKDILESQIPINKEENIPSRK